VLKELSEPKFIFVGNHRCLDFINTQIIEKGRPVDLLGDFSDLVEWLAKAQIVNSIEAKEALKYWDGQSEGRYTFEKAIAFRAVLREMVERIVKGRLVQQSTIDEINKLLSSRTGYYELMQLRGEFKVQFRTESDNSIHLIAPIAESASDLLCHGNLSLIKKCENPDCVLYFYDISKNHARRWCSMSICGNRTKVAAHYRRHRRTKEK
jgi:predicted RNA-binding Zn ribbon-like protein